MPVDLKVHQLDGRSGLEAFLGKNKASWNNNFRDRFSNTKLERAKKREISKNQRKKAL